MLDVVKVAIPFFFVLIGIEVLVLWKQGKLNYYRITDSINDLSCGIAQQVADIFMKVVLFGVGYQYIYEHWSIPKWFSVAYPSPDSWITWVVVFVALDFMYYWFHRHSHEVALFWAAHVVHHQSEEYNLTVALRQSIFQQFFSWFYYVIFAFAGIPFSMWFVCMGINLIYQFWVHTRAIGKLGFLEVFMNTPSHHRVHHGKDPKYCDKNHAGVFIIWDKMFGTFQQEEEEPVYGITVPLNSWNPLWANLSGYKSLFQEFIKTRGLKNRLKVLFGKPGWRTEERGGPIYPVEIDRKNYHRYETHLPTSTLYYLIFHFVLVLIFATQLLEYSKGFLDKALEEQLRIVGGSFLILLSLGNLGGIMENKPWVYRFEMFRLISIGAGFYALLPYFSSFWLCTLVSLTWILSQTFWFHWVFQRNKVQIEFSTPYPLKLN